MGEVTNIIHKAVNDNFKEPLDELIKRTNSEVENAISNKSGGLGINPAFKDSIKNHYYKHISSTYISKNQEEVQLEEFHGWSSHFAQRNEEVWKLHSTTTTDDSGNTIEHKYLRRFDLSTGITTDIELESDKGDILGASILVATDKYVYLAVTLNNAPYLLRYNKLTGEYIISETILPYYLTGYCYKYSSSVYSASYFMSYKGDIYACVDCNSTSTSYERGFFRVVDEIESGGSFSSTKISENKIVSWDTICYYNALRTIELTDNYLLATISSSSGLTLYKINVLTGEYTPVKTILSSSDSRPHCHTLCPIEHDGKVVGAIVGVGCYYTTYLVKINGSDVVVKDSYCLISSKSNADIKIGDIIACYKDGIFNLYDGKNKILIKDANLIPSSTDTDTVFLPKGTKFYSMHTKQILKISSFKLRDLVEVNEEGLLDYTSVYCDENHMFEIPEDGLYLIPIFRYLSSTYGHVWYYLGTFC